MVEGFWFGLGLIGAIGAVILVVFILLSASVAANSWQQERAERKTKRMREKGYANRDGKWVKVGDSEAAAEKAEYDHRLARNGMVEVKNRWKGLATNDDKAVWSETHYKDLVIKDIEQVNGEWVWKDKEAYERNRHRYGEW